MISREVLNKLTMLRTLQKLLGILIFKATNIWRQGNERAIIEDRQWWSNWR